MKLSDILTPTEITVLVKYYVHESVSKSEVTLCIDKCARHLVYSDRKLNAFPAPIKVYFNENELKQLVWYHFLQEEIKSGKTSYDIAEELSKELGYINGMFFKPPLLHLQSRLYTRRV